MRSGGKGNIQCVYGQNEGYIQVGSLSAGLGASSLSLSKPTSSELDFTKGTVGF